MKRLLTLCLFAITYLSINAQTPDWQWARNSFTTGGGNHDEGRGVAVDANGNVYTTGYFQSTNICFGTDTFIKGGGADVFLVKYDSNGNIIWSRSNIGSGYDYARSIAVDQSGNIFITGSSSSPTMIFGNDTLINVGSGNIFVIKFDGGGNVLWAKSAGGSASCRGLGIATDVNGNAYVTGHFYPATFTIDPYVLTNTGGQDVFIAKYDPTGNVLWAKNATGTGHDNGTSISTDDFGNVYILGNSNSPTLTFDAYPLANPEIFIAKYDVAGNVLWAKSSQGTGSENGFSVTTDVSGNCYATGRFSGATITFGAYTITNVNAVSLDVFIVKYDSAGNVLWAKSAGGIGNDRGYSIITDAASNVYVAGGYSVQSADSITFDTITLPYLPGDPYGPMFIAKYDSSGNALCAFSLPSGGDDEQAIGIDQLGTLYLAGDYGFSPYILGADTFTLTATEDVLVAKFTFLCCGFFDNDTTIDICANDSALIYGNYETVAGIYYDSLIDINNCDSIHYTILNVDTGYYINDTLVIICEGDSAFIYDNYETTPGTYYDTLKSDCGTDSVRFTVLTLVPVYATNDSITIAQGDSILLGGAYQTTAGIYYDTLMAANGCDSVVATTLIVTVGIDEHDISNQFTIYPNPTSGVFTAQGAAGEIRVYDLFGRTVLTTTKPEIDMRGYAKGVYFIKVGEMVRKLVLQ